MQSEADKPMTPSQETLYGLCFRQQLVAPQQLAYRLHKYTDYISDVCRRDRVDFMSIFNEILRGSEHLAATDPQRLFSVADPIAKLLFAGTGWNAMYVTPGTPSGDFASLCHQTGEMMKDLGGCIESLAAIEADGVVDESDDVRIQEFGNKAELLNTRLKSILVELCRRRSQEVQT